ncbi:MAG TPA: hypothetical protein VL728_16535 [Cyclobacteriaceae bacterium]|nr:hypothetical protein [Cyclobacteriaceae bacterium]
MITRQREWPGQFFQKGRQRGGRIEQRGGEYLLALIVSYWQKPIRQQKSQQLVLRDGQFFSPDFERILPGVKPAIQ